MEYTKNQHFVAQFHLRNFSSNGSEKIWTFNTQYSSVKEYPIVSVASSEYFYEIDPKTPDGVMEKRLSMLEDNCARIFRHIIDTKSLKDLSFEDRFDVALYVLAQQQRTAAAFLDSIEFQKGFRQRISDWFHAEEGYENFQFQEENPKLLWQDTLISCITNVPLLLEKKWALMVSDHEFYIGDNPSVMNNDIIREHRGNLGLKNKGIQLFLPLSDSITLGMFCPDYYDIQNNRTFPYMREFVHIVNYLQVENSIQFVYSSNKDFTLAKEMVQKGQNYRPRIVFS